MNVADSLNLLNKTTQDLLASHVLYSLQRYIAWTKQVIEKAVIIVSMNGHAENTLWGEWML